MRRRAAIAADHPSKRLHAAAIAHTRIPGKGASTAPAKIARAHLKEFPDYYTRLAKMEAEAEAAAGGTAQGE